MNTSSVLIIILLCIGALQGLIFGFFLIKSTHKNIVANRFLAILLFLLSYRLIVQIMRLFGLGYYDSWYYIMLDLSWINGAILYFYTRSYTNTDFKLKKSDWIHFVPLFIQVSISIFVRLQNLYWDGTRQSLSWLGYWGYVVWMNNSTIYIIACCLIIYYVNLSQKTLKVIDVSVRKNQKRLNWIKRILLSFKIYFTIVLAILLVDLVIFNITTDNSYFYFQRFYYYPFFIGISILTYWIGMEGFIRKDVDEIIVKKKLSSLEKNRLQEIAISLKKVMAEKKLYKNQDISIDLLAKEMNTKPYLISRCLNEIMDKKFNDYINEFRVLEVKQLLNETENNKYTLLSLAMEAGFNSKSSFNRAVKKQLGILPNQLKYKS